MCSNLRYKVSFYFEDSFCRLSCTKVLLESKNVLKIHGLTSVILTNLPAGYSSIDQNDWLKFDLLLQVYSSF